MSENKDPQIEILQSLNQTLSAHVTELRSENERLRIENARLRGLLREDAVGTVVAVAFDRTRDLVRDVRSIFNK